MRSVGMMSARLMVVAALGASLAACGGGATGTASAPAASAAPPESDAAPTSPGGGTGAIDCSLLTAADFATNGVDGAGAPTDNPDGTSHYCVYAGTSGATGGIEFDVFPHEDVASAQATYSTASGEGPTGAAPAGATFSQSSFAIDGDVAYLVVRQGRLVFALAVPNDINTEVGLVALANLVVQRAGGAAGE